MLTLVTYSLHFLYFQNAFRQISNPKEELRLTYTIGVILSAMPFPDCKPSLDMFINPNLDFIKTVLAIEVCKNYTTK